MIILSHRGWWLESAEKNTPTAFLHSFKNGYGTETDIRDFQGELVISHDIADATCMKITDFFSLYKAHGDGLPLALNIKADGLQLKLKDLLQAFNVTNYFVFDMSVPDGLGYLKHGITCFTRQSEYERTPSFYEKSSGVWLDEFYEPWINQSTLETHVKNNKKVCIVSPDLHKRSHGSRWNTYRTIDKTLAKDSIMLCTDYPDEARRFFSERD